MSLYKRKVFQFSLSSFYIGKLFEHNNPRDWCGATFSQMITNYSNDLFHSHSFLELVRSPYLALLLIPKTTAMETVISG